MTVLYLLDTDIASYIIKSKSALAERKLAAVPPAQVGISAITRAELLYGLKRLPANHPLQAAVRQFFRIVRVLAWEPAAADRYADIRHQLVTSGQPIGEMDMMIAAHALALGATLVTNNLRHYERIQMPLMLEDWAL
jgi:tRNA(fMet)-specific endonuclease VapC